jgi:hypothetical protein
MAEAEALGGEPGDGRAGQMAVQRDRGRGRAGCGQGKSKSRAGETFSLLQLQNGRTLTYPPLDHIRGGRHPEHQGQW